MPDDQLLLRRVVTGVNSLGRSCVLFDGPPAETLPLRGREALHEIWTHSPGLLRQSDDLDNGKGKVSLAPSSNGAKFRWFTLEPERSDTPPVEAEYTKVFDSIGGGDFRPDTSRHPSMHCTPTTGFIILLRGSVRLLLDDDERILSPGDVVVQRGTNHAWICESDEPALLIAVLIDADYVG